MIRGSYVALITPFNQDETINYQELSKLIEWQIENNTDGFVILGTTGESATLSDTERLQVVEYAVKQIAGRVPVIAGSGSNNAKHAKELSQAFEQLGVDGLLVVNPYYNKGNKQGILRYYQEINDAVNIPIILYNVPSRTGKNMEFELVKELSQLSNVKGIKEASGNISQITQIATLVNDEFSLLSGNDDQITPILSLGGTGVISACANVIPDPLHQLVDKFLNHDVEASKELQLRYLELINTLFIETNPIPSKKALKLMGFKTEYLRLPLAPLSVENTEILRKIMLEAGLL